MNLKDLAEQLDSTPTNQATGSDYTIQRRTVGGIRSKVTSGQNLVKMYKRDRLNAMKNPELGLAVANIDAVLDQLVVAAGKTKLTPIVLQTVNSLIQKINNATKNE